MKLQDEFWSWHRPHGSDVEYLIDGKGDTLVRTDPEEPLSEERKRLIAAAPELLAAAVDALAWINVALVAYDGGDPCPPENSGRTAAAELAAVLLRIKGDR